MTTLDVVLVGLIIGLLPAWIAQRKGQGFWTFYVFGVLLWIVAMPVALLMKDRRPKCPECAEHVRAEAKRCPHCQAEIEGRLVLPQAIGPS